MHAKIVGCASRIRIEMPLGARQDAWDCRPFGMGRIIAPKTTGIVELEPGMHLDLATGELRAQRVAKTAAA